ncbi:MAG TPA: DUF1080 domain-containing protein, partial [Candidatus Hydrogenedentes bacterium]|nr:DUF1080 domain-containing protein [Candidatus Hydrogenedentota bacterium]
MPVGGAHRGEVIMCTVAILAAALLETAAPVTITVRPEVEVGTINPYLYGHFLEHIYNSVVDGLWGQLIRGPSFEEYPETLGDDIIVVNGGWRFEGDELVGRGVDSHVLFGKYDWTDYTFTVEAKKEAGSEGFLILFRALDKDNFYWWNLGGWGNTYSAVEHEVGGKRMNLRARTGADIIIEQGRWYTVAVKVAGTSVECFLDGERVAGFRDSQNQRGAVGLGTWATDVRYRNARVTVDAKTVFALKPAQHVKQVSGLWRAVGDANAVYVQEEGNALNSRFCQGIKGDAGAGITQGNLPAEAGVAYTGSVWLRGHGTVMARFAGQEQMLAADADAWQEFPLAFTPKVSTADAEFSLVLAEKGKVLVDLCTLYRKDSPYRPAIYDLVKGIAPTFIRWPGGCYAEHYRWKDAIGPARERVTKPNNPWGGLDPNLFATTEFIQLCRDLDAEPIIVLNIAHHEPPEELDDYIQEALNWLEYCNGDASTDFGALRAEHGYPDPFDVRFWEIGNETWVMGVEAYAERAKRFVDALRAKQGDLEFLLCGSGGHGLKWNERMIELAGTHMDYLSVHHYMQGSFEDEMHNGVEYPKFLHQTAQIIANSPTPHIKIAVTEWNQQSTALRSG